MKIRLRHDGLCTADIVMYDNQIMIIMDNPDLDYVRVERNGWCGDVGPGAVLMRDIVDYAK